MQAQSLSRSTIVLAIVTCIPFGLAIKDTITGKYETDALEKFGRPEHVSNDSESDDVDYREVARARAVEEFDHRAALAARERAEQAKDEAELKSLFGPEVATLGSAFENIRLGEKVTARPTAGMLLDNGAASYALHVEVQGSGTCTKLAGLLRDVWGEGSRDEIWVNEHEGQRAILTSHPTCKLVFEKIAPLASWLDKSQASIVPMWAVGQPIAKVRAALGPKVPGAPDEPIGDQIMWTDVGLGTSNGPTQITVYAERGRVVGVLASFKTDPATFDGLIERISKLTGKQPEGDAAIWKSNPPIELQVGSQMTLIIGKSS